MQLGIVGTIPASCPLERQRKNGETVVHCYSAYGLSVTSSLPLPGLIPGRGTAADVQVHLDHSAPLPSGDGGSILCASASVDRAVLTWGSVGALLIEKGERIVVTPAPQADNESLALFILGAGMGVLLQQRGLLVLHGSGVVLGSRVTGFLGAKGSGKSTTAGVLNRRGHPLVSDELLVIRFDAAGVAWVLPAASPVRLWSDALSRLGASGDDTVRVRRGIDKFYLGATGLADREYPLERLHLLQGGEHLATEPVFASDAFFGIVPHVYGARFGTQFLQATGPAETFRQLNRLVRSVAVVRLLRQPNLARLDDIAELVESAGLRGMPVEALATTARS